MQFGAAFLSDGELFEVMKQDEGPLADTAELVSCPRCSGRLCGDDGHDPGFAEVVAVRGGVVALVAE